MSNDQLHVDDDRKMPIFIHSEVDKFPLTLEEFRVYAHLARIAGKKEFHASYASIAKACFRASYPTAKDDTLRRKAITAVEKLEQYGLIRKKVEKDVCTGVHKRNRYSLTDTDEWKWPEVVSGDTDGGGAYAPPQAPNKRAGGGANTPRSANAPRSANTPRSAYAPNSNSPIVSPALSSPQRVTPPPTLNDPYIDQSGEEEGVLSLSPDDEFGRKYAGLIAGMTPDQYRAFQMLSEFDMQPWKAAELVRENDYRFLLEHATAFRDEQDSDPSLRVNALVWRIKKKLPPRDLPMVVKYGLFWQMYAREEDKDENYESIVAQYYPSPQKQDEYTDIILG